MLVKKMSTVTRKFRVNDDDDDDDDDDDGNDDL